MEFAQRHAISDVCILCADVERSIRFYADKLGFRLLHRAEGFADFSGAGLTLALWEIDHISRHTGISNVKGPGAHKACIAVKLPSAEELDACYAELAGKGVAFQAPPRIIRGTPIAAISPGPMTKSGSSTPGATAAPRKARMIPADEDPDPQSPDPRHGRTAWRRAFRRRSSRRG